MSEKCIPHLCGGILFGLLLEAIKPRTKAKNKLQGGTDGLSNPDVYAGLIELVVGGDGYYGASTLEKCASDYKKCVSSKGSYVPFTDESTISGFDSSVKTKNPDLLKRMAEFTDRFLNRVKCEWLVRALIETMQKDPDIDQGKTEIAVNYSEKVKAADLHKIRNIEFYPFMISVINFILHYSPDAESGRPTFEAWYRQKGGAKTEWVYKGNIGSGIDPIVLSFEMPPAPAPENAAEASANEKGRTGCAEAEIDTDVDRNTIAENLSRPLGMFADALKYSTHQIAEQIRQDNKKTDSPGDEPEEEYVEAEVIDDKETDSSDGAKTVYIQNQTNIGQQTVNNFDMKDAHDITFNL